MDSINRRDFIKKSGMVSAGLTAGAPVHIRGFAKNKPSDIVNVAVAGIRSRGGYYYGGTGHTANFTKIKNSRVAAICDVDENLFPQAIADIEKLGGDKPKTVVDFRELLDDKDIDAVSIASPDHWHALQTIWACQAGKDVYVEKPLSYTVDEGRKMVQAARKYNRVVQTGTGFRSNRLVLKAIELLHDGIIGDVYMGRGIVFGHRANIGRFKDSVVPKGVNWDLFLGPAPYRPFNKNRFHYNWHWYWDTSTTEFGNAGAHSIDVIRWGMKKRVLPVKIHCCGGFYVWDSDQEVPNLQIGTFEFDDGKIMELEVRSLFTNYEEGERNSIFFYGSEGWMHLTYEKGFKVYLGRKSEPGPGMSPKDLKPDEYDKAEIDVHFSNFIDCVKSRKWQNLNAEILEGHMSTSTVLLGNVAYRTGRNLTFNPHAEKFVNDDDADTYLTREYRHPYVMPDKV
ncbi:Gfo/Idh/MocA family oxidoreductase [candidate division KSB1 bacterium]